MNKKTVVVVEDDKAISNLMVNILEMNKYKYYEAKNAKEAFMITRMYNPDVMILDLGLPDQDGLDVIEQIRNYSKMPIIVVSARDDDLDKIKALDLGADDYLTKPFSVAELLARLRVMFRRLADVSDQYGKESSLFVNGNLKIDYLAGIVYLNDEELHVTPIEYKLLTILSKNVGKVLTHNYITKEIWGTSYENDTMSLRVYMATLRKKLDKHSDMKLIQTHTGVGYRMIKIE